MLVCVYTVIKLYTYNLYALLYVDCVLVFKKAWSPFHHTFLVPSLGLKLDSPLSQGLGAPFLHLPTW